MIGYQATVTYLLVEGVRVGVGVGLRIGLGRVVRLASERRVVQALG